ncbi:MAG: very short patch repair endonuclease [Kiritimatiellia bacterium]
MADNLTPEKRSWNMSRVKSKNTKPELVLRSLLHSAGYRFTVNGPLNNKLPGKPDLVLPKYRSVAFVHGCFWHRHAGCKQTRTPKTNVEFWEKKFVRNIERDKENFIKLKTLGWKVIVVWECQLKKPEEVMRGIRDHLRSSDWSTHEKTELAAAEEINPYDA